MKDHTFVLTLQCGEKEATQVFPFDVVNHTPSVVWVTAAAMTNLLLRPALQDTDSRFEKLLARLRAQSEDLRSKGLDPAGLDAAADQLELELNLPSSTPFGP